MNQTELTALDFGKTPIPKLFRKILVPTLVGMIATVTITLADGIFVGHGAGSRALAAVNIIAPIYMIVTGIALMVGIGCSIAMSILLSQRKGKVASIHMSQSVVSSTVIMTLIALLLILFRTPVSSTFGGTLQLLAPASTYLAYLALGFPMLLLINIGLFVIRLDGSPRYAMLCSLIPAIVNLVLDFLFIMRWEMGIRGAALATVVGLFTGGVMVANYLLFCSHVLKLRFALPYKRHLRLTIRNLGWHAKLGYSALLGELAVSVMMFSGNYVFVRRLGEDGVAAYSVACYCYPMVFMIGNAIAQSAQPIISYNYGLGDAKRVSQTVRLLFATSIVFSLAASLLMVGMPGPIISLFLTPDTRAYEIAVNGVPLFSSGYLFFALNMATLSFYQSTERTRTANVFSTLRGMVLPIVMFLILPLFWDVPGIWLSIACAELITFLLLVCQVRYFSLSGSKIPGL